MPDPSVPGGDPLHEHDDPTERPLAPRDAAVERARRAHLREHLGVDPVVLSEKVSVGIQLDVLVFPPTRHRPYVVLASDGMSDLPMAGGTHRLELLIGVPMGWPGLDPLDGERMQDEAAYWPLRLLKDIARIPSTYDSTLSWGHTIVNDGNALIPASTGFDGALVGPPYGLSPEIMRAATPAGEVDYLAIFPVTAAEMDFKVAVPGGGDALLDRLHRAGVSLVAAAGRDSVVDGPPPYAAHLLFDRPLDHLGEALAKTLPGQAAALAQVEALDTTIPVSAEGTVWARVSDRPLLLPSWSEWADPRVDAAALGQAIDGHRSVLSLFPTAPGDGGPLASVISLAVMVAQEDPGVVAVWLPHQQYVTTPGSFTGDTDPDGESLLFRVNDLDISGGAAVITCGLAAIDGLEILFHEPGMSHADLRKRLLSAYNKTPGEWSTAPTAGTSLRYGFSKYELVEGAHPETGKAVLVMAPRGKEKRGLFRRRG